MMTAETRPVTQHKPWCNDHAPDSPDGSVPGTCSWEAKVGGGFVNVDDTEGQPPIVTVWGNPSGVTSSEARQVAAATIRASLFADGLSNASASVAANVARIVAEPQPMDVNDVEMLARLLDVSPSELFTD